jgi:hypothetical protein
MPTVESDRLTRRAAGRCVAAAILLIPRRLRFRLMVAASRSLGRFFVRTSAAAVDRERALDPPSETMLWRLMDVLTRYGVPFDPRIRMQGTPIERQPGDGRGVLVVGPHTMLSLLLLRYLHDQRLASLTAMWDPRFIIWGTTVPSSAIAPGASYLIRARTLLRSGAIVGAMIDAKDPDDSAGAVLQVALRTGARILFITAFLAGDDAVVINLEPPSSATDVDQIRRDFAAIIRTRSAAVTAAMTPAREVEQSAPPRAASS